MGTLCSIRGGLDEIEFEHYCCPECGFQLWQWWVAEVDEGVIHALVCAGCGYEETHGSAKGKD